MRDVFLEGLRLHPCDRDKRPRYDGWQRIATADRACFARLWQRRPGPLIGVVTGVTSGIDGLDIDPRHGGDKWLEANRHRLPVTRIHRTRGGGEHHIFKAIGQRGREIAPGVEVKANDQNLIWWPAHGYAVLVEGPAADFPRWVVEEAPKWTGIKNRAGAPLLTGGSSNHLPRDLYFKACSATHGPERRVCRALAVAFNARNHNRNDALFWTACRFAEFIAEEWISRADAEALLLEAASDYVRTDGEARALTTIRSGLLGKAPVTEGAPAPLFKSTDEGSAR